MTGGEQAPGFSQRPPTPIPGTSSIGSAHNEPRAARQRAKQPSTVIQHLPQPGATLGVPSDSTISTMCVHKTVSRKQDSGSRPNKNSVKPGKEQTGPEPEPMQGVEYHDRPLERQGERMQGIVYSDRGTAPSHPWKSSRDVARSRSDSYSAKSRGGLGASRYARLVNVLDPRSPASTPASTSGICETKPQSKDS